MASLAPAVLPRASVVLSIRPAGSYVIVTVSVNGERTLSTSPLLVAPVALP